MLYYINPLLANIFQSKIKTFFKKCTLNKTILGLRLSQKYLQNIIMTKNKKQKKQQIIPQEHSKRSEKKSKSKKNKKQNHQKNLNIQRQKTNELSYRPQKNCQEEHKISEIVPNKKKDSQQQPEQEDIQKLLSQLTVSHKLTPKQEVCEKINNQLEELVMNLLQNIIIRQSSINQTIQLARKTKQLSLNDYFNILYTNKLVFISQLLEKNSKRKYQKFIKKIQEEVKRVTRIFIESLERVTIYQQAFNDIKKNQKQQSGAYF